MIYVISTASGLPIMAYSTFGRAMDYVKKTFPDAEPLDGEKRIQSIYVNNKLVGRFTRVTLM